MVRKIITVDNKKDEKFLRQKTVDFDFSKFGKKEIHQLVSEMRKTMTAANGIGLSANQIGLNLNVFVAQVPNENGGFNFYSVFNPSIEKTSEKTIALEEGCLSVPLLYGSVERPEKVTLNGLDQNGRKIKMKAWGLLARVFQHEVDHLNGRLFTDKAKNVHTLPESERLKKREEKIQENNS